MNLDEFSTQLLTQRKSLFSDRSIVDQASRGYKKPGLTTLPLFEGAFSIIGKEEETEVLLANLFWDVLLSSRFFLERLRSIEIDLPAKQIGRAMLSVSKLNGPRYDLLLLSPSVSGGNPFSLSLDRLIGNPRRDEFLLSNEYQHWLERQMSFIPGREEGRSKIEELLFFLYRFPNPNFILLALRVQDFAVLVGPMPKVNRSSGIPRPGLGISLKEDGQVISSAGVLATDRSGNKGVTASLHGVVEDPDGLEELYNLSGNACVINRRVYINGVSGTVCSANYLTDSCFVKVDVDRLGNPMEINGPLRDRGPYEGEVVRFVSHQRSRKTAVTKVDIGITSLIKGRLVRVYTNAVTNPGESGSALLNEDNFVLGFSHLRTGVGEDIEFAEWIWADSVYKALNLETK